MSLTSEHHPLHLSMLAALAYYISTRSARFSIFLCAGIRPCQCGLSSIRTTVKTPQLIYLAHLCRNSFFFFARRLYRRASHTRRMEAKEFHSTSPLPFVSLFSKPHAASTSMTESGYYLRPAVAIKVPPSSQALL